MKKKILALYLLAVGYSLGQLPDNAQVYLYFPHLADGGSPAQQWQSTLTFINPNSAAASVVIHFFRDDGSALALDFGGGTSDHASFSLPAYGSRIFQSHIASNSIVSGWAIATASLPVQGIVAFREISNGKTLAEITANSTLPSTGYFSIANPNLGIAIANPYSNGSVSVLLRLYDNQGRFVGEQTITVPALGHQAFNLFQAIQGLPDTFTGMVYLSGVTAADRFVSWTLNADSGTLSTIPDGRLGLPVSQWERIWRVFTRVVLSAQQNISGFGSQPVTLQIKFDPVINALGGGNSVIIYLALAELISDSESELGFAVAHELGHVFQSRNGGATLFYPGNREFDADVFGLFVSIGAGYDPYAGAGALAKLYMATGQADLVTQFENQLASDAHKSFNTRLENMFIYLQAVCSMDRNLCDQYKAIYHPHLPSIAPLRAKLPLDNDAAK